MAKKKKTSTVIQSTFKPSKYKASPQEKSYNKKANKYADKVDNYGKFKYARQADYNKVIDQILNRPKFKYDSTGDTLYNNYKNQYTALGQLAMKDTMGQAAAMTGGYGSSYAQQAGQQTFNNYMMNLADKIPELYQLAQNTYQMENEMLQNKFNTVAADKGQEYSIYNDKFGRLQNSRDYYTSAAQNAHENGWNRYEFGQNMAYQLAKDKVENSQWAKEYTLEEKKLKKANSSSSRSGGRGGRSGYTGGYYVTQTTQTQQTVPTAEEAEKIISGIDKNILMSINQNRGLEGQLETIAMQLKNGNITKKQAQALYVDKGQTVLAKNLNDKSSSISKYVTSKKAGSGSRVDESAAISKTEFSKSVRKAGQKQYAKQVASTLRSGFVPGNDNKWTMLSSSEYTKKAKEFNKTYKKIGIQISTTSNYSKDYNNKAKEKAKNSTAKLSDRISGIVKNFATLATSVRAAVSGANQYSTGVFSSNIARQNLADNYWEVNYTIQQLKNEKKNYIEQYGENGYKETLKYLQGLKSNINTEIKNVDKYRDGYAKYKKEYGDKAEVNYNADINSNSYKKEYNIKTFSDLKSAIEKDNKTYNSKTSHTADEEARHLWLKNYMYNIGYKDKKMYDEYMKDEAANKNKNKINKWADKGFNEYLKNKGYSKDKFVNMEIQGKQSVWNDYAISKINEKIKSNDTEFMGFLKTNNYTKDSLKSLEQNDKANLWLKFIEDKGSDNYSTSEIKAKREYYVAQQDLLKAKDSKDFKENSKGNIIKDVLYVGTYENNAGEISENVENYRQMIERDKNSNFKKYDNKYSTPTKYLRDTLKQIYKAGYSSDNSKKTILNEDEEKAVKYYLNKMSTADSKEEYQKYYNELVPSLKKLLATQEFKDVQTQNMVDSIKKESIGTQIGLNILKIPADIVGGAISGVGDVVSLIKGEEIDEYDNWHAFSRFGEDVGTAVEQEIDENVHNNLAKNALKLGYQATVSGTESLVGGYALGSTGYGITMGLSAFDQKARQAQKNGASVGQILGASIASGIAEGLFEKYSFDKIVKMSKVGTFKSLFKNTVKSGLIEGSEELFTNWSNNLTDAVILADKSDNSIRIRELMRQGYTKDEATSKAMADVVKDDLWSFAVGGLSGGMIAGSVQTLSTIGTKTTDKSLGKTVNANQTTEKIIEVAKTLDTNSDAYKMAMDFEKRINNNQKISVQEKGKLVRLTNEQNQAEFDNSAEGKMSKARTNEIKKKLSDKLKDKGVKKDSADKTVKIIDKALTGQKLSIGEKVRLKTDSTAKAVLAEMQNEGDNADWVKAVNESVNGDFINYAGKALTIKEALGGNKGNYSNNLSYKSADGKAKSGKYLRIENIDGKSVDIKLNNGDVVDASTVNFGNNSLADLINYATDIDGTTATANAFIGAFNGSYQSVEQYALNFNEAYTKAKSGISLQAILDNKNIVLSETAKRMAYKLAQINKETKQKENAKQSTNEAWFDDTAIQGLELNDKQKDSVKVAEVISKVLNVNVKIFKSGVDENGNKIGENGSYNSATNTISIDVDAGINNISESGLNGAMLRTLSHELTHFIQNWSPTQYEELKKFVIETLESENNQTADEMASKIANEQNLSYEKAMDEVVARACEMMLQDSKAVERLVKQNRTLAQKVLDFIKSFYNKVKSAFEGVEARTQEANLIEKLNKFNEVLSIWDKALQSAAENSKSAIVEEELETDENGDMLFDDRDTAFSIKENMSEEERYEILKDKKIQPQEVEIDKNFDIDFLENNIKSVVEKGLIKKLKSFGYLKQYSSNAIDVVFEFTGNGLRKSIHSQENLYGGNLGDFAKVVFIMQKLLDNSVLIDVHSDKGKGTIRENPQLNRTYVLFSAMQEGNTIKPVQFEVMQYIDNNNRLYLAVALTKIEKTGVKGNTMLDENQASTYLLPVSDISIADIFKKINPKDKNFLKYIPNQFLNDEQIKAKERALKEDEKKYGTVQLEDRDNAYMQAVEKGDTATAQKMVDEKAMQWGAYSEDGKTPLKLYHGTQSFGFTEFDLDKMDDKQSIFLTSSIETASTYSGVESERNANSKIVDVDKLSNEELAKYLNENTPVDEDEIEYYYYSKEEATKKVDKAKELMKKVALEAKTILENENQLSETEKEYLQRVFEGVKNDNISEILIGLWYISNRSKAGNLFTLDVDEAEKQIRLVNDIQEKTGGEPENVFVESDIDGYHYHIMEVYEAQQRAKLMATSGNYSLYAKLKNPLVVDVEGRLWNDVRFEFKREPSEFSVYKGEDGYWYIFDYNESLRGVQGSKEKAEKAVKYLSTLTETWNTTRDVAEYAKYKGYDGVVFKNIKDDGGRGAYNANAFSDFIVVAFNANAVKSADAVTYDDNDEIIPPSERFREDNADIRFEQRENKYSYDELTSKPDMQITQLGVVSDEKYKKYKNARNLFAKDMREIARQENNDNNTISSVYLHNDDTNKDIIVGLKSYNHGAARLDNTYISVSEKLPQILKNAIAVNELTPRENSNETEVFIGIAENATNYVFVRMVVENRTQKLDNYDILYAVQKSKINKDEVAKSPRDRLQSNRLNSSSTISISDLLEIVKKNKLVTSVLSKDVLKKLGVERPDSVFADSLQYEQRDNIKEPKYVFANRLLRQFSSNADSGTVAQMLDDIYKAMDDGKNADKQIKEVAKLIYDSTYTFDKSADEQRKGFADEVRGYGIKITDLMRDEFGDDWADFVKKYGRIFNLTKNGKGSVDVAYDNLVEQFGVESGAVGAKDQLQAIADYYEQLKTNVISNDVSEELDAYGLDESEIDEYKSASISDIADYIKNQYDNYMKALDKAGYFDNTNRNLLANALMGATKNKDEQKKLRSYREVTRIANETEKQLKAVQKELNPLYFAEGKKDTEKIKRLEKKRNALQEKLNKIDRRLLQLETTQPLKDLVKRERDKAMKKQAEKGKQAVAKVRERRKASVYKDSIRKLKDRMQQRILRPTENSYVPSYLVKAMVDVCNVLDFDTAEFNKNGSINKAQAQRNEIKAKLSLLKNEYDKLKDDPNSDYSSEHDEAVSLMLQNLVDEVNDTKVKDMSGGQLERVYSILKGINLCLQDASKQIREGEQITNYEIGMDIIGEQRTLGKKKSNFVAFEAVSPLRNVLRMAGYNQNSELVRLANEINEGVRRKNFFVMTARNLFANLKNGNKANTKAFNNACTEEIDFGFTDKSGNTVKTSKMIAMQVYMTYMREAKSGGKLAHLIKSGCTLPDVKLINKGKVQEALDKGAKVEVTPRIIDNIQEKFTDYDKAFITQAENLFNEVCKNAINETTLKTKHRLVATGDYYIPEYVDKDFVVREIDGANDLQSTVNNMGMLQTLKEGASQPLIMTGLNLVIDNHIEDVGKVYGLSIPIRNFNKVWNIKESGNTTTVKKSINNNWGKNGVKLIEQMVKDVQCSRVVDNEAIGKTINSMQNAFVVAKLASNISVMIKQAASLETAKAVIDYRPTSWMIAKFFATATRYRKICNEIDKHTAQHFVRRQGLSTQELGDLATSTGLLNRLANKVPAIVNPYKWIQGIDCITTATFWNMCKYDIKKQGKYKVGSDEYWKAVTQLYDRCIEETQPMYDSLHRPEIQKTKNALVRQLVMFRTQPLQNAGILYTAFGEFKTNKTAENAKKFGKAVASQISSALLFVTMTLFANALLHRLKRYRDDETEELTMQSVLKTMIADLRNVGAGVLFPIGGSELDNFLKSLSEGKSWGKSALLSVPVVEFVNDFFESVSEVFKDPSPETAYDLVVRVLEMFNVPAQNAINIANGVKQNFLDIKNGKYSYDPSTNARINRAFIAIDNGDEKAYKENFKKWVEQLKAKGKTEAEAKEEISRKLVNRIKQEYLTENYSVQKAEKLLKEYGGLDDTKAKQKIREWKAYNFDNDGDGINDKYKGKLDLDGNGKDDGWSVYTDLREGVVSDDSDDIEKARKVLKDEGMKQDSVDTATKTAIKNAYLQGEITLKQAKNIYMKFKLKSVDGKKVKPSENDAYWYGAELEYAKKNGTSDDVESFSKYTKLDTAIEKGDTDTVVEAVNELYNHYNGTKTTAAEKWSDVQSSITKAIGELYKNGKKTQAVRMMYFVQRKFGMYSGSGRKWGISQYIKNWEKDLAEK